MVTFLVVPSFNLRCRETEEIFSDSEDCLMGEEEKEGEGEGKWTRI